MGNKKKKSVDRLERRRKAFDAIAAQARRGFKRPGSQNRRNKG